MKSSEIFNGQIQRFRGKRPTQATWRVFRELTAAEEEKM